MIVRNQQNRVQQSYFQHDRSSWLLIVGLSFLLAVLVSGCGAKGRSLTPPPPKQVEQPNTKPLPTEYVIGDIARKCDASLERVTKRLDQVSASENPLVEFEDSMADFNDEVQPLIFMGYVSPVEFQRDEASACEEKVGQFAVGVMTRRDLYNAISLSKVKLEPNELRLFSETLSSFKKNGLALSEEGLNEFRDLKQALAKLESDFSKNLNEDKTRLEFEPSELEGLSSGFLESLSKTADGKLIVSTKTPHYVAVMENARRSETRRKMLLAYTNRAAGLNTSLLEGAIILRQKIATLMGKKTWADYQTDGRMAQDANTVLTLLNGLKGKLSARNKRDLDLLLDEKKLEHPEAQKLDQWDINYYAAQLKKKSFSLDDEVIREYFPKDKVMKGMFEVYAQILGLQFEEVVGAQVWHEDVKLYAVRDQSSGELLSYFFTDLFPRDGKYGHAAAFTLIQGRRDGAGYNRPVSSIVANFTPPMGGKPSLLTHDEVETIFHEFGHIMHQILTRAPYATLSGTSVATDFVEAPSQVMENWVWQSDILSKISGHFENESKTLPQELLQKMLAAKDFNQGYYYTRQLMLGLTDMTYHTASGPVDVTAVYDQMFRDLIGVEPISGGHFPAGFGHLMGGYDAGYYGYIWSEVYAADMFTQFEKGGLLSPEVGMRYRRMVLEKGRMDDPLSLVEGFLNRKVSFDAFYKKLGI